MSGTAPAQDSPALRRVLLDGLAAAGDREALAAELGVVAGGEEPPDDRALLRAVAERVAERASAALVLAPDRREDPRPEAGGAASLASADASLPARLGRAEGGVAIESVAEVSTLLLVLRGGSLAQQRAAVRRLAEVASDRSRRLQSAEQRQAVRAIEELRHPGLAWARHEALLRLGGGAARQARAETEARRELFERALQRARAWWEGERPMEPLEAMPGDERARLLLWIREAEDALAWHVGALLEGSEPSVGREARLALLSSCRFSGDARLVPALLAVLQTEGGALAAEAGRALGSVEDPRALPALQDAFERAVLDTTRAALAGALGELGDRRGLPLVRALLEGDEPGRVQAALGALESLGEPEDAERVVRWLGAEDRALSLQAVRTLGRIGDARALEPLAGMLADPALAPGLRRAVQEAIEAVKARMELRGEETVRLPMLGERASVLPPPPGGEAEEPELPGWRARLGARWSFAVGRLWALLGMRERALRRFEEAARRWPRWLAPRLSAARQLAAQGRYGLALAAFRLALEADRRGVERSESAMEALVRAFLRRAEELEREGRREVARGLVDEVRALDLGRVPGPLRFEVERRAEDLRLWLGPGGEEAGGRP